jgi:hypothetical protein
VISLYQVKRLFYGEAFNFEFHLSTWASTFDPANVPDARLIATTASGSGSASFFNTFTIAGLHVLDSSSNPVQARQQRSCENNLDPLGVRVRASAVG